MTSEERILALLRAHGWNTTSFQVVEEGFSYWFDDRADAFVAYFDTGGAWVAAGAPIAAEEDLAAVARRFVAAAKAASRRACFCAVEDRFARIGDVESMLVGEQPVWDPTAWGRGGKNLREQLRRARAKGVTTRLISAADIDEVRGALDELIATWLRQRRLAPLGFLVDIQPFELFSERRSFLAEHQGRIVGLLVAVPIFPRQGWLVEDIVRASDAPNGTTELLIDTAMSTLAREGSHYVSLGLAPLSGNVGGVLRWLRDRSPLYDFAGIQRFRTKLGPHAWNPVHIAWPRGASRWRAMLDALSAFTMRGRDGHRRASFFRFALETIVHSPRLVVRTMALMLVPWTVGLSLHATTRFFPGRHVQVAWVVFDVLLACGMFLLAARWRPTLARGLALATLLDATLTVTEVVADAMRRAHGALDDLVLLAACLGPILATSLLWGTLRWQRRDVVRGSVTDS